MKKRNPRRKASSPEPTDPPHVRALRRVIKVAGGNQTKFAERIARFSPNLSTVSQQTISYWLNNQTLLDPKYWAAIESVSGQQVTRRDLRPDIFGREERAA